MRSDSLTQARLKEVLHYDPETGVFTRLTTGLVAGSRTGRYCYISVDGYLYLAHRLVWLYLFNRWPTADVDHIDGDGRNNRRGNLREATHAQNQQNQRRGQGKAGLLGVTYDASTQRYMARLTVGGKTHHLGRHGTPEEAHAAYVKAKREHHPFSTF